MGLISGKAEPAHGTNSCTLWSLNSVLKAGSWDGGRGESLVPPISHTGEGSLLLTRDEFCFHNSREIREDLPQGVTPQDRNGSWWNCRNCSSLPLCGATSERQVELRMSSTSLHSFFFLQLGPANLISGLSMQEPDTGALPRQAAGVRSSSKLLVLEDG